MMNNKEFAAAAAIFLDRPIAFHRCLALVGGGVAEGIFMSQCLYWWNTVNRKMPERQGWFQKDDDGWRSETTLSRHELMAAKKTWMELKVLRSERRNMRRDTFYNVNFPRLARLIWDKCSIEPRYSQILAKSEFQTSGSPDSGLRLSETQDIEYKNTPLTPLSGGDVSTVGDLGSDLASEPPEFDATLAQGASEPLNAGRKTPGPSAVKSTPKSAGSKTPSKRPVAKIKTPEFNKAVQDTIDLWYETHRVEKGMKPVDNLAVGRKNV
jgi:hypothetical protein